MSNQIKPPTWFWAVSILALIWNLMGVMAYISQVTMSPETLQALPENERALYEAMPTWATSAFAVAVWFSFFGSLMLLGRKKIATIIFIIAYAGVLVQMAYSLFISNSIEVYGPGGMVMPVMILIFGLGLIVFSRKAAANGWID